MKPTEQTKNHVISAYVEPARRKGEKTVQVRVGNVQKELGWTNRTPSVFSTLSSKEFQEEAGVVLIEKRGGPVSGGPSTTWQFVYRLTGEGSSEAAHPGKGGSSLLAAYGSCRGMWDEDGGVDAWLRKERDWGPDLWERYALEMEAAKKAGKGE
jgi:hypothetical protein